VPRAAAPELLGHQRPRLAAVPPAVSSAGAEAADLAERAGLVLDPWQRYVLDAALGEKADGRWSAFEVGLIVSRQNGKGSILEARELAGLFLFGERLILHSAHEFKTASEAFRRVLGLIKQTPELNRRVKRVQQAHGDEGIELHDGARLRFVARSSGSGRGFTGDLVILDEAYNLDERAMEALLPTLSARPNPQVWYTSSAGGPNSVQLGRVRRRGVAGDDPALAFFEWSARAKALGDDVDDDPTDPAVWAQANPAMGRRITAEYVARELPALGVPSFVKERLAVGDYPPDEADGTWGVVPRDSWLSLVDLTSRLEDPVALAVDVTPDQSAATIAAAGQRPDGLHHIEITDHRPGTAWVVPRLAELVDRHGPIGVVIDRRSPAGSLYEAAERAGVPLEPFGTQDLAAACGQWVSAVAERELRHLDQPELRTALAGAERRTLGEGAFALARRGVDVDISPAVAAILALWLYRSVPPPKVFGDDDLGDDDEGQELADDRDGGWP